MNTEYRFKNAVKALRSEGIKVRQNVLKCCRSCIEAQDLGMKDENQPYAFTYGGQGFALTWREGNLYTRSALKGRYNNYLPSETVKSVFFNWGNGAGERIAEVFLAEGFEVNWDGSEYSVVEVKIPVTFV